MTIRKLTLATTFIVKEIIGEDDSGQRRLEVPRTTEVTVKLLFMSKKESRQSA